MTERELNRIDVPDAQLERALASYTPAEVPTGLERRLVARLTAAAVVPRRWPAVFAIPWGWAACALFAISLATVVIHAHRRPRTDTGPQPAPGARLNRPLKNPSPGQEVSGHDLSRAADATESTRALAPAGASAPSWRQHRIFPQTAKPANPAEASLSEMRAPSRPAPRAPLTAEEKMLLRVVERRDPEQLAMLNPLVRASREEESDKEFQNFVEQSSTANQ